MTRHLGLDLGGTNIKVAVLQETAGALEVVVTRTTATGADQGPERVAIRLAEVARQTGAGHGPFATVGLGVPGLFDSDTGNTLVIPNLAGDWVGFPLRRLVAEEIGAPVSMINDARAFTLAESTMGAGKGCRVIVALVLGTGVGGGITIDGRLHLGAFGTAGEIGHQTVIPDGPLCGCGNRGCLEALAKADVLARLAGGETAEDVYAAAGRGDPRALEAIDEVAGYLGIVIANAVTFLGPDRVILGGGIAQAGELLLGPVRQAMVERLTLVPTDRVEVVLAELGSHAGAIGAALAGKVQAEALAR